MTPRNKAHRDASGALLPSTPLEHGVNLMPARVRKDSFVTEGHGIPVRELRLGAANPPAAISMGRLQARFAAAIASHAQHRFDSGETRL